MTQMTDAHTPALSTAAWETRDTKLVALGLAIAAVAAIAAQVTGLVKIQAVVGLISILLIAYLWSTNRRAIVMAARKRESAVSARRHFPSSQ